MQLVSARPEDFLTLSPRTDRFIWPPASLDPLAPVKLKGWESQGVGPPERAERLAGGCSLAHTQFLLL